MDGRNARPHNTRLAQWGLTSVIGGLCFYSKFVLVDNLFFQNPPLRQAWERYSQLKNRHYLLMQIYIRNFTYFFDKPIN